MRHDTRPGEPSPASERQAFRGGARFDSSGRLVTLTGEDMFEQRGREIGAMTSPRVLVVPLPWGEDGEPSTVDASKVLPSLQWTRHASRESDYLRGRLEGSEIRILLDLEEAELWPCVSWSPARQQAWVDEVREALRQLVCTPPQQS